MVPRETLPGSTPIPPVDPLNVKYGCRFHVPVELLARAHPEHKPRVLLDAQTRVLRQLAEALVGQSRWVADIRWYALTGFGSGVWNRRCEPWDPQQDVPPWADVLEVSARARPRSPEPPQDEEAT